MELNAQAAVSIRYTLSTDRRFFLSSQWHVCWVVSFVLFCPSVVYVYKVGDTTKGT